MASALNDEMHVQPVDGAGRPYALAGVPGRSITNIVQSPTKGFDLILSPLAVGNSPAARRRLFVRHGYMHNAAGAAVKCGLGPQLATTKYECGQISSAGVYTSDTTDFVDAGASDFAVSTTVNDTGCILSASEKWNLSKIVVGAAEGGVAGTYALSYWNGASWAALTSYLVDTPDWTAAATTYLTFFLPSDWATGGQTDAAADISALSGKYAIKIKATTAPTVSGAQITSGLIARLDRVQTIGAAAGAEIVGRYPIICSRGDSLIAYWGTAAATSYVVASGDNNP